SNNSPYKFNGMELDEETGWYYYGARYYDPRVRVWMRVDPLAEKFPGWSQYNYALQNPIKYIDPDETAPLTDYFWYDSKGNLVVRRVTDGKHEIKVWASNTKQFVPLSSLSDSRGSMKKKNKIVAHYAAKTGLSGKYGVTNTEGSIGGYFDPKSKNVYLSNNKIREGVYNNYYDLQSALEHEGSLTLGHKGENIPSELYKYKDHAQIYFNQATTDIFSKSTDDNKYSVAAGYATRVYNAYINNEEGART